MMTAEKEVGERIILSPLGVRGLTVEGTIIDVRNSGQPYVEYKIAWDDNKFGGEWWAASELTQPED